MTLSPTLSPFPSREQLPVSITGMAGNAEYQSQIGRFFRDSHQHPKTWISKLCCSTQPNTCLTPADCVTWPDFWSHSFSAPSTHQTQRPRPIPFFGVLFLPSPQTVPSSSLGKWEHSISHHCGKPTAPTPDLAQTPVLRNISFIPA